MTGQWVFLAISALAGILYSFENHLIAVFLSIILFARFVCARQYRMLLLSALSFFAFFVLAEKAASRNVTHFPSPGPVHLLATFQETPQIDGNRMTAVTKTSQGEKLMLSYRIKSEQEKKQLEQFLKAGKTCRMTGTLSRPHPNRNEHLFHYGKYLQRKNIHWIFEPGQIQAYSCTSGTFSLFHFLENVRSEGIRIIRNTFPEHLAAYGEALIFGERSSLSEEANKGYQKLGVVHLLAISGLHVGMIAGASIFLLLRAGWTYEASYWIMVFWLPLYGLLSGGNPPVVRAVLMALFILSAKRWGTRISTLDALSISFLAVLAFDPYFIYDIGFQLSYAVSFGIILSVPHIRHLHAFWQTVSISNISLLSSLPILSYHFHEFSIISLIANLVFIPFYTLFLMPAVFLLFFLGLILGPVAGQLALLLEKVLIVSENAAIWAGSFPFATIWTGKPSGIAVFFMTAGVLACFLLAERKCQPLKAALPLILILVVHCASIRYSPYGEVIFIDVGQGDSILIKLPFNEGIYMIDTGGRLHFPQEEWQERKKTFGVGKDILIPVLKSRGIHRIDKLILTHSDVDHMGAAKELFGEISIGKIYISPRSWEKPLMLETIQLAKEKKIDVIEAKAGFGWKTTSGSFQFIYPFDDHYEGNNDSLVLYGTLGGKTWLFMGDAEQEAEQELIAAYPGLSADVVKVGHHGSRTSTAPAFIQKANPEFAIISAGENNRYGHPHPEVLDVLEKSGVHIFRTDRQGAVHFRFRAGKTGTFKTVLQYDVTNNGRQ